MHFKAGRAADLTTLPGLKTLHEPHLLGILGPEAQPESLKPLQLTSSLQEIQGMEEQVK